MPARQPHQVRMGQSPLGTAVLALSRRGGVGSVFTSDAVDVSRDRIKTFGVRGNQRGSWFLDVSFGSAMGFFNLDAGTFPASVGSIKTVSVQEAFQAMRMRVRSQVVGSFSVLYAGQYP